MQQTESSQDPTTTTANDHLFSHRVRPDWGLALMAWERDGKRGYQFEDGKLRVFKNGYYHYLQLVDRPRDETDRVIASLTTKLGRRKAARRIGGAGSVSISPAMQVALFRDLYPKGFQGTKWSREKRGIDAKRALKRHRAPVLAEARELLSIERLDAWLREGRATEAVAALAGLLESTNLVTKREVTAFGRAAGPVAERLIRRLRELLDGEDPLELRFERYLSALGRAIRKTPSWKLATALPALARPREHFCVKSSVIPYQAAWMAPSLEVTKQPSGRIYRRLCEMAQNLAAKLETEHQLAARDLLDVHDFIWVTLRPKAREQIVEMTANSGAETAGSEASAA